MAQEGHYQFPTVWIEVQAEGISCWLCGGIIFFWTLQFYMLVFHQGLVQYAHFQLQLQGHIVTTVLQLLNAFSQECAQGG